MSKNEWHYAVVVGIDAYPGVSDLRLPRHDAREFKTWLLSPQGGNLPRENVHCVMIEQDEPAFADAFAAEPTSDQLDKTLARIHKHYTTRLNNDPEGWDSSRLYLYASGHGIVASEGTGAVLFASADPVQNYWDGAEVAEYKSWYFTARLFREVLIFTDCCRERRPQAPQMRPRLGKVVDFGPPCTVYVMFGAELGERAYEPNPDEIDQTRGYFTQALIHGLEGGATDPRTGEISGYTLFNYVKNAVTAVTHDTKFPQTPDQDGNSAIVIRPPGEPLPRREHKVRLVFPEGFTGRVRLWRRQEQIGDWDAASGPWELTLPEDLEYTVQPLDGQPPFANGGAFRVIAKDADVHL